ncbi:uncharacterized protein KY384_002329 [Bacidia gigantensis]|uniref:uncharacterized protein n=1 Tax=Bacidia gigantensis TaxID=2732470 RepID=UPI001D0429D9|nr:uncharacterized protein KY384_002329 [Bacidia gigantensis]KAG8532452.1 hypothetical protein KY384_002329 [Bacidia gigantensis]
MPPQPQSTSLSTHYSEPADSDAHFDQLDDTSLKYPDLRDPIPKVAHFICTSGDPLTWIQWLAIRGAIVNLQVEKVRLWIPAEAQLEGELWKLVLQMKEVSVERIVLPTHVYSTKVKNAGESADLVKLKVLWEEGGIYLENDLIALRSSDGVLDSTTRATIMAERLQPAGVPNWMIMSKPQSPFLMRWMEEYAEEKDFATLATVTPFEFLKNRDPDLRVLDGRTWFYPLASSLDGDSSLKKLWFGKSWYDIADVYGTHLWHWSEAFRNLITPELVRTIDTPLFCRLRGLFDGVGGVKSLPWDQDENCNVTIIPDLSIKEGRLFLDYQARGDREGIKMLDQSGHNNHGWAVNGTQLYRGYRTISENSFAVMPVPVGWDARVWTLHTKLRVDPSCLKSTEATGLIKIRMDDEKELLIQLRTESNGPALDIHWESTKQDKYHKNEDFSWISAPKLAPLTEAAHDLTISFDRRDNGSVAVYLDGEDAGGEDISLIYSPKIGQEIWLNSRHWDNLDTGFRGELYRFTMFADAIGPQKVVEILGSKTGGRLPAFHLNTPSLDMVAMPMSLLPILFVVLLVGLSVKQGKALRRNLAEVGKMVVEIVRKSTSR